MQNQSLFINRESKNDENTVLITKLKALINEAHIKINNGDNPKLGFGGLCNLGNTCYMNAILQCLRHTTLLNGYLFSSKIPAIILKNYENNEKTDINNKITLLFSYMKIIIDLCENKNGYVIPNHFKMITSKISDCNQFIGFEQHDSGEFLVKLLDIFHISLSKNVKYKIIGSIINDYDKQIHKAHEAWAIHYKNRHSTILDIFSGQLRTKMICPDLECNFISYKYDPLMVFDISIPNSISVGDLYQCLDHYIQPEELSKDNMLLCEKCKKKQQTQLVRSIWTLPNILIIVLKRFKWTWTPLGYKNSKINTHINYPINDLDLSKYVSLLTGTSTKYNLYAVTNHVGDANSGHYYAYCHNELKNKWYQFDDTCVTELNDYAIVNQNAYILFYKKQ